jgi:hypothetical protein
MDRDNDRVIVGDRNDDVDAVIGRDNDLVTVGDRVDDVDAVMDRDDDRVRDEDLDTDDNRDKVGDGEVDRELIALPVVVTVDVRGVDLTAAVAAA